MKRILFYAILSGIFIFTATSQETEQNDFTPSGTPTFRIYWNYNYNFTKDVDQRNTFALQRAYFGYKYKFSENISAKLTIDAARKSGASDFTAFLKHAQLDWKISDPVKLSLGLIGNQQFNTQEKFWGYRYLFKSFQDEFKFGSSADLGFNVEFSPKSISFLQINAFVLNGEGYTNDQDNMGRMKIGGNVIAKPGDFTLKIFYSNYGGKVLVDDTVAVDTSSINTIAFFAGYDNKKFRIGGGYSMMMGGTKYNKIAKDHDLSGFHVNSTFVLNKKFQVFGTWMQFKSNKIEGASQSWNYDEDGNLVLVGFQYSPVKGVKIAPNYRNYLHDNPDINDKHAFFVNFEYRF